MGMDVDAVLLDRVFQPVTDQVAEWVDCFGLARFALAVAVEAQAAALMRDLQTSDSPAQAGITIGIGLLTLLGAQQSWSLIRRVERQTQPGHLNVRRISLRWQRLVWLATCSCCIALLLSTGGIGSAFAAMSCLAWVALVYFISCSKSEPMLRSSRAWAAAR